MGQVPSQTPEEAEAAAAAAKQPAPNPPAHDPTASEPASTSADDMTPSTPVHESEADKAKSNKQIAANRAKEIDAMDSYDEDEKTILKLYDQGVHAYEIARRVFKFANGDSVGKVMLTIRKEHADDYEELESVNSTKGYTGVGVGA